MNDSNPSNLNLGTISLETKSLVALTLPPENKLQAAIVEATFGLPTQELMLQMTHDVTADVGLKLIKAAYFTYADATFIEALHKVGVPEELIQQAATLCRLKRQAGNG